MHVLFIEGGDLVVVGSAEKLAGDGDGVAMYVVAVLGQIIDFAIRISGVVWRPVVMDDAESGEIGW